MMKAARLTLAATLLLVQFAAGTTPSQAAGTCIKDKRTVRLSDYVARFENLLCRTEDGGTPLIVERHRLSEYASLALVGAPSDLKLEVLIGTQDSLKNVIFETYKRLADKYASPSQPRQVGIKKSGDHIVAGEISNTAALPKSQGENRVSSFPRFYLFDQLKAENDEVRQSNRFPNDFAMHYYKYNEGTERSPKWSGAAVPWRYLDRALLASLMPSQINDFTKAVQLYNDLTESNSPEGLAIVHGKLENLTDDLECAAASWSGFTSLTPSITLEVAVIRNTSRTTVNIESVLGQIDGVEILRETSRAALIDRKQIAVPKTQLPPGKAIAIPVAIALVPPEGVTPDAVARATSERIWRAIQKRPPDHVFTFGPAGQTIQKRASSFKAPTYPEMKEFNYGPRWDITGLVVDGKEISLTEAPANFLDLTYGTDGASCPYVVAYDEANGHWVTLGKVIHEAQGKTAEMSEQRRLPGLVTRFRIEEREPETAYINAVALTLRTDDGREIKLAPQDEKLQRVDSDYLVIEAMQSHAVNFELPADIAREDVLSSELSITGYYERLDQRPRLTELLRLGRPRNASPLPTGE